MKFKAIAAFLGGAALVGGTSHFDSLAIFHDDPGGTPPTCSTADGAGDVCIEYDLEVQDDVVITDDLTVSDDVTFGDDVSIGGNITLENSETIKNDTNNEIEFGNGTEDLSLGFGTSNECTVTTDSGVTRVDFGSIGLKTDTPLLRIESQHFCGQGANGTTATYIGPVLKSAAADETTYVFGAAGCDGLDNTTEATADAPLDTRGDIKVVGMTCVIADGGTDDVYTFQMRDDTADVTGVTCNVTLDGSGDDTCSVILDAPVTVASASAVAVKQVAATDDDCSGCDTECFVYYTR